MDVKIYLIENIDENNPNLVYIGKTKNNRKSIHKKKFGNQIQYTYIDEIESLFAKDWIWLECYWIEQFKQWGFTLTNKNKGGGGPETQSEEFKQKLRKPRSQEVKDKISKSNTGKKVSEESKIKMRKPRNYSPPRIPRSKEHRENLSKTKMGKPSKLKGRSQSQETKNKKSQVMKGKKYKKHNLEANIKKYKSILQYDKKGKFIKEWVSIKEAGETLNICRSSISAVAHNKVKTAGKFIWKFKDNG